MRPSLRSLLNATAAAASAKTIIVPVLIAAFVGGANFANADLLRWNLQNVTFVDGGTASGFFLLDTATTSAGPLNDFSIHVSGGGFPSFDYRPSKSSGDGVAAPCSGCVELPGVQFWPLPPGHVPGRHLILNTNGALNHGGTFTLSSTSSLASIRDISFEYLAGARYIHSGSITTGEPQPRPHGTLVRWNLEGVRFDDGSPAVGSFLYDSAVGVVEFNIRLPSYAGAFNQESPCPGCGKVDVVDSGLQFSTTSHYGEFVRLITAQPLTERGGTVALVPGAVVQANPFAFSGSGFQCCGISQPTGLLVSGVLVGTVVPEPSQVFFLLCALTILLVCQYDWRVLCGWHRQPVLSAGQLRRGQ
jgi:hypothetical protein